MKVSFHTIFLIVILILGSCLGNLSQTALNAMFSGIAADFNIEVGLGQWVTTIYMLVLGITVPAVTFLTRRFATKTVVLGALVLLFFGSTLDIFAWDFYTLIAGRVLQAISTGITMPMMMSEIMVSFPRNKQATVMGIAGISMGFAPNIGPTIGGWMIGFTSWRSFFLVLSGAALLLVALAALFIKITPAVNRRVSFDVLSFVLSAFGFGGLLLGCSNASSYSLTSPFIWAPLAVGAVALALFARRQKHLDVPLINFAIFASSRFTVSFWAGNFLFASFMGITLILPLFIENQWGGTALDAGIALLPGTFAALFINPLAGILTDKIGVRPVVVVASVFLFVGAAAMVLLDESTPFWFIVLMQGVRATGVSGLISPLSSWGMSDLPHEIMTDASSFSTAARQACASVGTALMVFMISFLPEAGLSALMGYQLAFAVSAIFALLMLLSACVWVRSNKTA